MKAQNFKRISVEELDSLLKMSSGNKQFYLSDSKGIYDNNSIFYEINDKVYFFSKLLNYGYEVQISKDYIEFIRLSEIPNPFKDSIHLFLENNKSTRVYEMMKRYNFSIDSNLLQISEGDFKKIKRNKKAFYPILTLFIGEIIKDKVNGKWDIEVDNHFFIHTPVIKTDDKTYYPSLIVSKILEDNFLDIKWLLDLYATPDKS